MRSDDLQNGSGTKWMWWSAGFVALLGSLAVIAALAAPVDAFGGERGRRHHGMGGEFLQWKLDRMLSKVDASDDQRSRIEALVGGTLESLEDARPDRRALHDQMRAALTGDTVDRAALEALRADQLVRFEALSGQLTQALADAAEVLTPEQRVKLAALLEEHGGRHGPGRSGRHGSHGGWH